MNRILIAGLILSTAAVVWIVQGERVAALREDVQRLRESAADRSPTERGGREAMARKTGRRDGAEALANSGRRQPAESDPTAREAERAREQAGRVAVGDGDRLKARQLAEQMGLGEEEGARIMPMLARHAARERVTMEEVLRQAGDLLGGDVDYGALSASLRGRASVREQAADLRDELHGSALQVLEAFEETQERNLLQLLADKEFEAWTHTLPLEEHEQEAYDAFYEQWQTRLREPLPAEFSVDDLDEKLRDERSRILQQFSTLLSEEGLDLMRVVLEAGHEMILHAHENR